MEKRFQSVALVQKVDEGRTRWFVRKNGASHAWRFVVGERLEKESFRETALREVAWQLNLNRQTDFLVSNMAQLSVEFTETDPESLRGLHIALAFYQVQVYRQSALDVLESNRSGRWVAAAEICAGKTNDGQAIDPQVVRWINQWQIIQHWQE